MGGSPKLRQQCTISDMNDSDHYKRLHLIAELFSPVICIVSWKWIWKGSSGCTVAWEQSTRRMDTRVEAADDPNELYHCLDGAGNSSLKTNKESINVTNRMTGATVV
ncbi:hypothetical protein CRM22_000020 [Opisthorchis felineus]|uniref:Uncharacterized protein n=1 Tax=Opisthorchis felineus TaxID=147828 RepID=A0A4S2MGX4_OPIFE|nr:hypothetical protein CRM22_000020 [Opisthorchis felineus]